MCVQGRSRVISHTCPSSPLPIKKGGEGRGSVSRMHYFLRPLIELLVGVQESGLRRLIFIIPLWYPLS